MALNVEEIGKELFANIHNESAKTEVREEIPRLLSREDEIFLRQLEQFSNQEKQYLNSFSKQEIMQALKLFSKREQILDKIARLM
ncbi:MAG: hypothetical protein HQK53_01285 [Oligoflexia bacterium]|nr:hypothetical protein [Oligoflexia bacterium]